jgi:hypothetical protein
MVDRVLAALQDRDDVKGIAQLVEDALWPIEVRGDLLCVRGGENEELEAGIGGRKVLDVHLSRVRRAHKYVRK